MVSELHGDDRAWFDELLEDVLDAMPPALHDLLEQSPLIVEDAPTRDMLKSVGLEDPESLCGLYTGVPLTERSVSDSGEMPDVIRIFRRGIVAAAGGWDVAPETLREEIRVTVLHEIGHHFGLDEDDLDDLGYG